VLHEPRKIFATVFLIVEDYKIWCESKNRFTLRIFGAAEFGQQRDTLGRMRAVVRHPNDAVANAEGKEGFGDARDEADDALRWGRERNNTLEVVEELHDSAGKGQFANRPAKLGRDKIPH
jgi:hypothetical protein